MSAPAGESTDRAELRSALERLRLDGAIFLRAEYTDGWAYDSPSVDELADLLQPGADRLVLFHIVARGGCWVQVGDGERYWADEGDVIVLPYADQHRMGGPSDAPTVPLATLLDAPPWKELPVIRLGEGGSRTDVVCGYLHSLDPLFDPALRALPPVFVVKPSSVAAQWVKASIDYALEQTSNSVAPGPVPAATRLPELLLTEILEQYLASAPSDETGFLAALHDPILAPALSLLHHQPERKWTVADLAGEVAASRSVLDERFRKVLGISPIRYLSEWRLHLARDLLANTKMTVGAIATQVGYESQEAFSRTFKRTHGTAPSAWRDSQGSS